MVTARVQHYEDLNWSQDSLVSTLEPLVEMVVEKEL